MYVLRRVIKTQPRKAREVSGYLTKICRAYEAARGRNEAKIYIGGSGVPGTPNMVYAEWTQERLDPLISEKVPEAVRTNSAKMVPLVVENTIEFYDLATPAKLKEWGFD